MKIKLNNETGMDLERLISSKLFIYANSGYGKSWLIRRLLEQSFDKIQHIVIDPEGEFSTLREKHDYILIGKGYDIAADPKTAHLLAHRLLQEKVSAIVDLYELEPLDREKFVANFTMALVNVPKNLHHPYLFLVDEAQDFAPEKGDSLSSKSLHSIAKKGRKRGCCPIFATQRVSDFSKAVIACCNNKLIGQASLDLDMKRCAYELGFSTKEQILSLRDLEPGEFYAFGPALTKVVQKIKIGAVSTTHPDSSKMGSRIGVKVVPASPKIKSILAKLADLPAEAQKEAQTVAEFKAEIRSLKAKLAHIPQKIVEKDPKAIEKAVQIALTANDRKWQRIVDLKKKLIVDVDKHITQARSLIGNEAIKDAAGSNPDFHFGDIPVHVVNTEKLTPKTLHIAVESLRQNKPPMWEEDLKEKKMGEGEQKILISIAQNNEPITREHITVLTAYKRSTRDRYLQCLFARGFVSASGEGIIATEAGVEALGDFERLPEGPALLEHLLKTLPEGERKILYVLSREYPESVSRNTLTQETNYQRSTRDRYLQSMQARKIVVDEGRGMVRAADKLFQS